MIDSKVEFLVSRFYVVPSSWHCYCDIDQVPDSLDDVPLRVHIRTTEYLLMVSIVIYQVRTGTYRMFEYLCNIPHRQSTFIHIYIPRIWWWPWCLPFLVPVPLFVFCIYLTVVYLWRFLKNQSKYRNNVVRTPTYYRRLFYSPIIASKSIILFLSLPCLPCASRLQIIRTNWALGTTLLSTGITVLGNEQAFIKSFIHNYLRVLVPVLTVIADSQVFETTSIYNYWVTVTIRGFPSFSIEI